MNCAICYDAITASTGKIELSCSHSFHINCLSTWFSTQNTHLFTQTCPCCRHEMNKNEAMPTGLDETIIDRFQEYEKEVNIWYDDVKERMLRMSMSYRAEIAYLNKELAQSRLSASVREKRDEIKKTWAQWTMEGKK